VNLPETLLLSLCLPACAGPLPPPPDYADPSQWFAVRRGGPADLFYVISTETADRTLPDGTVFHNADTCDPAQREAMRLEMQGVDDILPGGLDFFSPYYRQCSIESFADPALAAERMVPAAEDVRRAFAHYLAHENRGRPFVLAGFSQGAQTVLRLLQEMDGETFSRMVTAYAIGATIPQEFLDACPRIVPARGADDTGVTACWNSVRAPSCALWPRSAAAINPANWRCDATPARFATEPSPFIPLDRQRKEPLVATLDPASNLVVVEGYTARDYVIPVIGREGNYHAREIWLYRDSIRENMALRVRRWLEAHPPSPAGNGKDNP
jgi:hypothetical protein